MEIQFEIEQLMNQIKAFFYRLCNTQYDTIAEQSGGSMDALNEIIHARVAEAKRNLVIEHQEKQPEPTWMTISLSYFARIFLLAHTPQADADPVSHPMNPEYIRMLSVYFYNTRRDQWFKDQGIDTTCSICQNDFKNNDQVIHLICQHFFHRQCIVPWLNQSNTCPLCRTVLDDYQFLEIKHDSNGITIMEMGYRCEEIFDLLLKVEKKIGRWGILNMDQKLYKDLTVLHHEIFQMVEDIEPLPVRDNVVSIRNLVLKKIELLSAEITKLSHFIGK